jgi:hypothetical protein
MDLDKALSAIVVIVYVSSKGLKIREEGTPVVLDRRGWHN